MISRFAFRSTRTLTGRLATFFTVIALMIALAVVVIFFEGLKLSEDLMGERRILIDRERAIELFNAGEEGVITLDYLTTAYSDITLIPQCFREELAPHDSFLGEIEVSADETGFMIYKGRYSFRGEMRDIILISRIDRIEFTAGEMLAEGLLVVSFVTVLLFIFGTLLHRLSAYLIRPLNDLTAQLQQHSGQSQVSFEIDAQAADEFQLLTQHLNHYRNELDATLKREQAFARYASHELRTPLTVVKGAVKLLSHTEQSDFQRRQIGRITDGTEQMITIVDALLSIVRYERNTDDAPMRTVSRAEVESILSASHDQADSKGIDLVLDVRGEPTICATTAVLSIVLGNLLRNAIAATPAGVITVTLDKDSLSVLDQGTGLTGTPRKDGHGLGLMIVDDLSHRYNWHFTLKNAQPKGCFAHIQFMSTDN